MNPAAPTIVSLFAGVGGFDVGFHKAGFRTVALVEKNENCQRVLWRRFPGVLIHGDVKTFLRPYMKWLPLLYGRITAVCGGSPCQDLSVAGARAGLDGERSGLFYEMVRICKRLRRECGLKYVTWENVAGALSSNDGRDFAAVLRAFTGLQVEVPADGWGNAGFLRTPFPACRWNVAWRVLDARYFGVPQRRRRVFLVASFGDASCCEILFEPESLSRHPLESRAEGEDAAAGTLRCSDGGSDVTHAEAGHLIPDVAGCLQERDSKGADSDTKPGHLIPIAIPLQEVGKRTGKSTTDPRAGIGIGKDGDAMYTLQASAQHAIAFDPTQITCPDNRSQPAPGGPCHTLPANGHPPAIAFSCKDHGADAGDVSPTLRAMGHASSHPNGGGQVAIAFHGSQDPDVSGQVTHPLGTNRGKEACFAQGMAVRRLTPRECERLQGFADDWTDRQSDSARYAQMGNAVATVHAEWIARRMAAVIARDEEARRCA